MTIIKLHQIVLNFVPMMGVQYNNNNNNNNNVFYLKAPFKALKDTAYNNNSTTKNRGQFSAKIKIDK